MRQQVPQPVISGRQAKVRSFAKRQLRAAVVVQRAIQKRKQERLRVEARGISWWYE